MVVSGPQGLDEAGLDGETQLAILENGQVTLSSFQPEDIGMERIEIDQVRGGDAKRNAEILLSVLKNEAKSLLRGDGLECWPWFLCQRQGRFYQGGDCLGT